MNMVKKRQKLIRPQWQPGKAALVGTLATLTYSLAMEGDKFLIGNRFSDVRFIQGLIEGKKRTPKITALSWALHFFNGVALAELYGAVLKRYLPGPDWLKGAIFGEMFIVSAWWLTPFADKHHPLIKNQELPQLANWTSFWQNIVRHLVFGLTLGLLYKDEK
ncbi:DUF6789 family protein [Dictyobacter arantiisoli]|uniref:DUF1440 domain-containing protein n=1 Tax=Dictyobacter arantiisoli TaxID=2014874 RepID=A0A5A5TEB0_9CHLR|nr:DUF6789 family protein [Dictyobacter arantiisoli]GCF09349.1 hypothetical protein KDI_29130 [Dictyobacter arantiisoli]